MHVHIHCADGEAGQPVPNVGGSLVFFSKDNYVDIGEPEQEQYIRQTVEFYHVESWDIVFGPGANGRVREILAAVQPNAPTIHGGVEMDEELNDEPQGGRLRERAVIFVDRPCEGPGREA